MPCPICNQKPMNCDCTPRERAMYRELQERGDQPVEVLTDAERAAVWFAIAYAQNAGHQCESALRGLLERLSPQS